MPTIVQSDQILLIARVILGAIFVYYGWPKLKDLAKNAKDTSKMGFKPGMFWGTILVVAEFIGGIALIIGFFAEIAALIIAFEMLVGTFWKIKLKKGFPNWSYDLLALSSALVIARFGPGAFSVNRVIFVNLLRWDVVIGAIIVALVLAYLPQILGKGYHKWKA